MSYRAKHSGRREVPIAVPQLISSVQPTTGTQAAGAQRRSRMGGRSGECVVIRRIHRSWLSYEREGTPLRVLEFCRADCVWVPPRGRARRGKRAIREWLLKQSVMTVRARVTQIEVRVVGRTASLTAKFQTRFRAGGNRRWLSVAGQHHWFLICDQRTKWRVAFLAWEVR